ncbi:MAG: hypothetical protein ACRDSP_16515 [Pseudonocardiaceae bacterium]
MYRESVEHDGLRPAHPVAPVVQPLTAPNRLLALQYTAGNRAVAGLVRSLQRCGGQRHAGCACAADPHQADAQRGELDGAAQYASVQRKPPGAKPVAKPSVPKLGACKPVQDDLKPSKPWAELQKGYQASCVATQSRVLDELFSGKAPTSADAKGTVDCACAVGPPIVAAEAAKARLAVAGPLALALYQHFLDGSGAEWTIDVADMLQRDAGVRHKIHAAMSSGALTGTTRLEQSNYQVEDFQFAFGAIDCVQWVVTLPPRTKRKDTTPVKIAMLDYYEFHPGRTGVSQCAHAACVELVARGSAKNFWTRGDATVPWGLLKT